MFDRFGANRSGGGRQNSVLLDHCEFIYKVWPMIPISGWYDRLGQFTFPTVFIGLDEEERAALLAPDEAPGADMQSAAAERVVAGLQHAIHALPGSGFVGADVCAATDSSAHGGSARVSNGRRAWEVLRGSAKTRQAFEQGLSTRLTVRPWRNMNRIREFRLFFHCGRLTAMSQMNLDRHFARFARRQDYLWEEAVRLAGEISHGLPTENLTVDIYFCANGDLLVVDMNQWGPPTDPLLLRTWDRDWSREIGLKLIPPPVRMGGDVSVSF